MKSPFGFSHLNLIFYTLTLQLLRKPEQLRYDLSSLGKQTIFFVCAKICFCCLKGNPAPLKFGLCILIAIVWAAQKLCREVQLLHYWGADNESHDHNRRLQQLVMKNNLIAWRLMGRKEAELYFKKQVFQETHLSRLVLDFDCS